MRVLVGWDDEVEAETINLILNVDEVEIEITTDAAEFERLATERNWDCVLMATTFWNPRCPTWRAAQTLAIPPCATGTSSV